MIIITTMFLCEGSDVAVCEDLDVVVCEGSDVAVCERFGLLFH